MNKSLSVVDEKYDDLQKQCNKYTLEQLRMWDQMIRIGKHESTDNLSDKPFWSGIHCWQDSFQASPPKRPLVALSANSPPRKVFRA